MKRFPTILLLFAAACQSSTHDVITTGHPLGKLTADNDYSVDITFEDRIIEGEASGTTVLGIFSFGASEYSQGLAVTAPTSSDGMVGQVTGAIGSAIGALVSFIPVTFGERIRGAAIRSALREASEQAGKDYDLLGYPMYVVDEMDYILWSHQTVRAKGFPGTINSISNHPSETLLESIEMHMREESTAQDMQRITLEKDLERMKLKLVEN